MFSFEEIAASVRGLLAMTSENQNDFSTAPVAHVHRNCGARRTKTVRTTASPQVRFNHGSEVVSGPQSRVHNVASCFPAVACADVQVRKVKHKLG